MGSDMAMERLHTTAKYRAEWIIHNDHPILTLLRYDPYAGNGWKEVWQGNILTGDSAYTLIELITGESVPAKPEPPYNLDHALLRILIDVQGSRRMQDEDSDEYIKQIKEAFERFK